MSTALTIITVDARGQSCPGPLVALAKALRDAEPGSLLELLATDPGSKSDVPSWASISGNALVESHEGPDGSFRYVVRKA
jgi:tRNA 2-thiouridine synthesizing protein A